MQKVTFYSIVRSGTNEAYVGSSINLRGRWKTHRFDLRHNKHHCKSLQEAYNKFGPESFEWLILECRECSDVYERAAIELQWIIKSGTYNAMSKYVTIENLIPYTAEQRTLKSAETLAKIAHNPEYAAFLSQRGAAISAYMKSPEGRAAMSEHSKRRWQDPEERKRLRSGLEKWCKDSDALAIHAEKGRIREANPERIAVHAARTKALWNDPVVGAKYREAGKIRWSDPKAKERQAQKMREYHTRRRAAKATENS